MRLCRYRLGALTLFQPFSSIFTATARRYQFDKMSDMPKCFSLFHCLLVLHCLLAAVPAANAANNSAENSITVYLTVDWEGWSLDEENLQAMRDFRARHPQIPMLHLLNPVYYLRPGADAQAITALIRSTLLPIDTVGLHLHGWKTLLLACQLPYRTAPSFANTDETCPGKECGYTVSLEFAYSAAELEALVACSSDLLAGQGFNRPRHFRAGGWQLGPKLTSALQQNGFTWDSSRLDADLLLPKWTEDSGLVQLVRQLHADASIFDQPRELLPDLMQFPNNAGLMDYTSTEQLLDIFRQLLDAKKPVMVTGFHQETAFVYLDNLEDAIRGMQTMAAERGIRLEWGRYD